MTPSSPQATSRLLPWLLAISVLFMGGGSTYLYWDHTRKQEAQNLERQFQDAANVAAINIAQKFKTYQAVMRGIQGFFRGSQQVTYEEFFQYTSSLELVDELNGIQAIAFVEAVAAPDLAEHEQRIAGELNQPYRVTPAGDRPLYAPIVYIQPMTAENLDALGFDVFTNEAAREAAEGSRDSGDIAITGALALAQDATLQSQNRSFVMYLPVYRVNQPTANPEQRRAALIGWVDVPFRMQDFMAGLAGEFNPHIDIEIYDGTEADAESLLFHSDDVSYGERNRAGEPQTSHSIQVGAREWTLLMSGTPEFRAEAVPSSRAFIVAATGALFSIVFAALVCSIARGRDRSERRAARTGHLYHALSEINQAILRLETEEQLFPLVCRMAVTYGGMKMAWVGMIDETTDRVIPVASSGASPDFLDELKISTNGDLPEGRGPTGSALRENRAVIVNDYLAATYTTLWHRFAQRYGWKSSAAFPVPRAGKPFAVLNVYHAKIGAFDDDVINLLQEMSNDISFALDNFDREKQRRAFERALAESETRLSTILDSVGASIYLKDTGGHYLFANKQALNLWGAADKEDVLGTDDTRFFSGPSLASLQENDRAVLENGEIVRAEEIVTLKQSGATRSFWSVKLPLRDSDGNIYGLCGISTDMTENKAREERIRYLSNYDTLTNLPNRQLLQEKARLAFASANSQNSGLSLLCINLDRFKIINESLGHSIGDLVLQEVARRMAAELHLNATLCRLGGDHFLALLSGANINTTVAIARQLLSAIAAPMTLKGHELSITANVGIALAPDHGHNLEQLIQAADAALFNAQKGGPNNIQVFSHSMRALAEETLQIERDLREALQKDQLLLHYQPQVDIHSGRIVGIEALVRWQHPELGLIPPIRFIPVAEQSGLIIDIGTWVMEAAASQLASWHKQGFEVPSVSVNLSAPQLYKANFVETVQNLVYRHRLSDGMLDLELTENIAMEHSTQTLLTLGQLRTLGITLSIDDFGIGYSSLSYLKRYPVHRLKIDKSFVDGLGRDPENEAIVLAIIGMARGLGFKTVAEGVETPEQLEFLKSNGCDTYQGFYFSKPLPAAQIPALVRQQVKT
ncbi:MAG: EAL domain-containing protein [Porticoccaceae bacterium]